VTWHDNDMAIKFPQPLLCHPRSSPSPRRPRNADERACQWQWQWAAGARTAAAAALIYLRHRDESLRGETNAAVGSRSMASEREEIRARLVTRCAAVLIPSSIVWVRVYCL
jgi:hypothetical protein